MPTGRPGQGGYTLIGLLFLVAGLGVGLAAVGTLWQTAVQREKERELLLIGEQFRQALADYRRVTPAGSPRNPPSLEALLLDERFPHTVRHLRRLWRDPMTGRPEWGLVRDAAGGITGLYSLGEGKPLKTTGFAPGREGFAAAASYRDWVFSAPDGDDPAIDTARPVEPAPAAEPVPQTQAAAAPLPRTEAAAAAPGPRLPGCQTRMRQALLVCPQLGQDEAEVRVCREAVMEAYRACVRGE